MTPNEVAAELVRRALRGETGGLFEAIGDLTEAALRDDLTDDTRRLAFWINVYNAGVRFDVIRDTERKQRKYLFFARNGLVVAGKRLTFNQIEHGMLRRSMLGFSMGYVPNPLPGRFEREFRVPRRDPRVHFALNCGARSCPPVQVYEPGTVDRQLELATRDYLVGNSSFDGEAGTVVAPRLLHWYRGDFGGTPGILRLLHSHGVIPATAGVRVRFGEYDWGAE